jgi:hypothetical protein
MPTRLLVPALLAACLPAAENLLPTPQRVQADLGERRANWTQNAWTVHRFEAPRDLSAFAGLRVRASAAKPLPSVEVYVALQEADGTWRYHPRACPLSATSNSAEIRLIDFVPAEWVAPAGGKHHDENQVLDLGAIAAVAVGTVQPFGVGQVEFTVEALELLPAPATAPRTPAAVNVSGRMLAVNGTTMLPAGVFGAFHVPKATWDRYRLTLTRSMDHGGVFAGAPAAPKPGRQFPMYTLGDRGVPSPVLSDPQGWKAKLTAAATAAATKTKEAGGGAVLEFWNEPYLNWANKNRVAFDPRFYDTSGQAEGAPVKLKNGSAMPHLKWTQKPENIPAIPREHWRRGRDASGKMLSLLHEPPHWERQTRVNWRPETHPPKDVADGQTYTVTVKTKQGEEKLELTAFTPWRIYDETQFTFWSAKGMARLYNEPMVAVGEAFKAVDPAAFYIIGWCSRPIEDHFAAWELAYKPSIDAAGKLADAVNDHDYGGDPLRMEASAELVAAYSATAIGKMLASINSETSAAPDPEAYPGAKQDPAQMDGSKYRFALRKIVSGLARQPDKMVGYAFFGDGEGPSKSYFSPGGEGVAFDLLMQLRGRLVQATANDAELRVVAAVDGTDPMNPRPEALGAGPVLTVAVLNDGLAPREASIDIAAPAGTAFIAGAKVLRGTDPAGRPAVVAADHQASGTATRWSGSIPSHDAVVLQLPLDKAPAPGVQAQRLAAFSPLTAHLVTREKPYRADVAASADFVALAKRPGARAWLRLAVENLAAGEAVAVIGGQRLPIPAVVASDNGSWLVELPLPVSAVAATMPLAVEIVDPARTAGVRLAAATVYVEAVQ